MQVSGKKIRELHGWSSRYEVGEDGQGAHEDLAHQPIGQTPQIMTPEAFEMRPLDQLAKDDIQCDSANERVADSYVARDHGGGDGREPAASVHGARTLHLAEHFDEWRDDPPTAA